MNEWNYNKSVRWENAIERTENEREIVNEWENGKCGENERENMKGVWENKER